jgi:predicted transcriptional regulator
MTNEEIQERDRRRASVLARLEATGVQQNDLAALMRVSPQALSLMLTDDQASFPMHRYQQALEAIAVLAPTAVQEE